MQMRIRGNNRPTNQAEGTYLSDRSRPRSASFSFPPGPSHDFTGDDNPSSCNAPHVNTLSSLARYGGHPAGFLAALLATAWILAPAFAQDPPDIGTGQNDPGAHDPGSGTTLTCAGSLDTSFTVGSGVRTAQGYANEAELEHVALRTERQRAHLRQLLARAGGSAARSRPTSVRRRAGPGLCARSCTARSSAPWPASPTVA